jgi:signal transduction histidine kinase
MTIAPRLLIVDDDPALLRALPETLRLRLGNVRVDTCNSAHSAIGQVAEIDYDVIVSDIKMPGMDGLALLSRIKEVRPNTPTLLITGHGEHDLTIQALRGGAYDFIQKPIERDYLIAAVSRAIQNRQMSRELEESHAALARHAAELERLVEERTHDLQEANRVKDEFLATLSHELRAPLNSIFGWAQLLRGGLLDDESTDRALRTIVRNAKALGEIVDDLLDVSRIITGKLKLDARVISIGSVIEAAVDSVRLAAETKQIDLMVSIDESSPVVSGDPNRLQQVVWNLLSNSIKFTPAGGWVRVEIKRTDGSCQIVIQDNGEGIGADFLPYVFDRFRQADSGYTRRHGGLGVGLAIVRHLVEMHGGEVHAESPGKGQGAVFTVTIPLARADRDSNLVGHKVGTGPLDTQLGLHGVRILVVDDDPDARELLVAMLEHRGAEVAALDSAASVTEWLMRNPPPDVLISDIGMPGEDGIDLITRLRSSDSVDTNEIPALALTAYARPEERERILAAGYRSHLTKPIEPDVLIREIAALVAHRHGKRQYRSRAL